MYLYSENSDEKEGRSTLECEEHVLVEYNVDELPCSLKEKGVNRNDSRPRPTIYE